VGGGFRFILLHHLHHELVVAVYSGQRGKWTNTLRAGWGVAAVGTCGVGSGNLARRQWGSAGGLERFFFGPVEGRGARKGRGIAGGGYSEGWEEGRREIFWGLILPRTWARGYFSTVPPAAGAPDRVLPRRGRRGSAGCLFRIQRVPAYFWARRWYINLGPEPKIHDDRVLEGVLGAPVEML
jgi:hypothetical protein